ncbi:glutamate-cysteine ligase family protein [Symbioplanes lichenis]|uniref:glutamate-cysteine ligase family protein n=1 Tax=Symbioplanes lichenis TaxID=1629072 RepID=UPI00273A28E6|nr:glutamate-cysteine ligase family protein [Actinoplanes lichenis]
MRTSALVASGALTPARPGFIGAEVDLVPAQRLAAGRVPLRHGFLEVRPSGPVVLSGPPSPGVAVALTRMTADLALVPGTLTGGVRVHLEAGLDERGLLGLPRRWALAHAVAPVLAAAFANSPLRDGRPTGWRSRRQASRVLPAAADVAAHLGSAHFPVSARGHLAIDVADAQPGDGWQVPVAVISALLDEPRAAVQALGAVEPLRDQPGLWERAARDGLSDPLLARAARLCFVAAYEGLARQGVARDTRDAVAGFLDRYVMRARCPADDVLASA